jgi:hypothetical protein
MSASVYECGRFTCTIKQHLGQMPPKHVAGLPTEVMNDKGRYRQEHLMIQTFVQRLCPTALTYPISPRNDSRKTLEQAHLGLLKETSIIIHDGPGLAGLAVLLGIKHTIGARQSDGERTCRGS